MRIRQAAYALVRPERDGVTPVLLQLRPLSASLMPGMWGLPEITVEDSDEQRLEITVRHAITVTNYRVQVLRFSEREAAPRWTARENPRQWTDCSELGRLPLTGLARKVLRRLQIMP